MVYDEQLLTVKWNASNREWYENKGYQYTGHNSSLIVPFRNLMPGSAVKIQAICDYCGEKYVTQNDVLRKGRMKYPKDCCPHCAGKKASDISRVKRARKCFEQLRIICEKNDYDLLTTEEEYTDLHMVIRYRCKRHGDKESIADNLMRGHGCLECSYEARFDGMRHDQDYVNAVIANIKDNTWLNYGEYHGMHERNLRIKCACGNVYETSFINFLKSGVNQCYSCSCKESVGEAIVRLYLDEHHIEYVSEKRFDDCRDKRPLPFDFFLPDQNMVIEFDGQHHYEEVSHFGNLEITKRHDQIKDQYCKDRGIRIIRIPYYEGNRIADILKENIII